MSILVTSSPLAAIQKLSLPLCNDSTANHLSPVTKNGMTPKRKIDSILKVNGTDIVDGNGHKVILKGAGLGGHLNMENFITGFSGHELSLIHISEPTRLGMISYA